MKTKVFKILLIICATVLYQSCTNLDEKIYSSIVSEQYEPTEKDLISIIAPSYTTMRDVLFAWHGYYDLQSECSDEIVTPARPNGWEDGGVYRNLHEHNWNSEQSHLYGAWNNNYTGVNYANRSIYQIESGTLTITDEVVKNNILAELRAMRALYYYNLLDNFRNVAFIDRYDVPEDFLPEQIEAKKLFQFIEEELKEVIPSLSDVVDQSTYGRMTKYAAQFLLARLYLNAEVYINEAKWKECSEICDYIIESKKYALDPNYRDIFKTENQNSTEIVFAIPFDEKYGGWFHFHMKTLHPANMRTYNLQGGEPWGGSCAIPQFIDTYDKDDERLPATWIMGQQYDSSGEPLYCTLDEKRADDLLIFTNTCPGVDKTSETDGYRVGKFEIKMGALGSLSNDFPLFRYADVLLMKSESELRQGNASLAASLVSEVRSRAFKNNPDKAIVTAEELMKGSSYNYGHIVDGKMVEEQGGTDIKFGRMLDELGWEFAAEGHRRMDLVRFGVFTTKKWLSKNRVNQVYRNYFPILEQALTKNTNLKQNDGY